MKGLQIISYRETPFFENDYLIYVINLIDFDKNVCYSYNTYEKQDIGYKLRDFKFKLKPLHDKYMIINNSTFNKILNLEIEFLCNCSKPNFFKKFDLDEWNI